MGLRARSALALSLALAFTLAMASVIGLSALGSLRSELGTTFARNATRLSEFRVLAPVARDLALAERLAASEATRAWLADDGDAAKKDAFFREAESFRQDFVERSYFVALESSRAFYYNDEKGPASYEPRYRLEEQNPAHGWFFATLTNAADHNLNVDYDAGLDLTKLWINVAVHEGGRRVGVVGTGFDLGALVDGVLGADPESGVTPIVLNDDGYIQMHPDLSQVAQMSGSGAPPLAERTLFGLLNGGDRRRVREAIDSARRDPDAVEVTPVGLGGRTQLLAMSYVPELRWLVVSAVDLGVAGVTDTGSLTRAALAMIALPTALVIAFVLAVDRYIIRPLRRLQTSAQAIADGDYGVALPATERGEIGALTDTVAVMAGKVRQHTEELESTVEARTKDLRAALVELRDTKDAAERANEAKSDFLAGMSHEMRTPLAAILGFGRLLELDDRGDNPAVKNILAAGNHLLDIVNEVLDLSKIEAGQLTIAVEPVDIDDLIAQSLDLIRPIADAAAIAVEHRPSAAGAYASGDPQRVRQVLLNLLSNGVKYNRPGGRVTVSRHLPGDGWVRVEVADTGPGMSAAQLARVFEPFERLGAEHTRVEGTGLGLTLSKRLVEAMRGVIDVRSSGSGTTFMVGLPVTDAPTGSASGSDDDPAATGAGTPLRVLYIEDDPVNIALVESVLRRRPETTMTAAPEGLTGLELAQRSRPDIILLDLQLPDIDGEDLLHRLKRSPATSDIPVVIFSADASPDRIERLRAAGAVDYLTKPAEVERLLEVVDGRYRSPASAVVKEG